jgi:pyruvate/2-oxoglutarate dehydrogenase complex dihydrolipoamide acyltransferase (E2) component
MSLSVTLPPPPLGDSQLTVLRWLKQPGTVIARGEPLLIVRNNLVEIALPAPDNGVLETLLVDEGDSVGVGEPVARYKAEAAVQVPSSKNSTHNQRLRVSPVARKVAQTLGVDLTQVQGSGPKGAIYKRDVLAAIDDQQPTVDKQVSRDVLPLPHRDKALFPWYVLTAMEVDMGSVVQALDQQGDLQGRGIQPDWKARVVAAVAQSLLRHPLLNGIWQEDEIVVRRRVHLAVDLDGRSCYVADAQDLNTRGVMRRLTAPSTSTNGDVTFALAFGTEARTWADTAPVSPPRNRLTWGAVQLRPVVVADGAVERITARPVATMVLSYDARVLDQHHADAFLRDIKERLTRQL